MDASETARAIDAALSIAVTLGLPADTASVLHNSNKLSLRLLPCDVFARVSSSGHEHARFEIQLAQLLAAAGGSVAELEPRVAPRGYEHDGFEVSLWRYYEPAAAMISPKAYSDALERLHSAMRTVHVVTPHFSDRVAEAEQVVRNHERSPALDADDRDMLASTMTRLRRSLDDRAPVEQLLHGEPHPGNLLSTVGGPRFIDLETCCRGPVEFDLAHVPTAVSDRYPGVDRALLGDCRQLVLAMVAAWRWDADDHFPNGLWFGDELISALRSGPPWPTLDELVGRAGPAVPQTAIRPG